MIQKNDYLAPLLDEMARQWPKNRLVNIVCHGHSVPAGYFATPYVNTFSSYPHLSHVNHPTEAGHRPVAEEIAKYFVAR